MTIAPLMILFLKPKVLMLFSDPVAPVVVTDAAVTLVNVGLPPYSTESPAVVPADNPVNLWLAIGKFAVIVCVPSFNTQVLNAVAISELVVLVVEDEIVVPVTTGLPEGRE
jgi:hypothetical protein